MTTEKSPYQVKWVIIDNYSKHVWKYQEKQLKKLGFEVIRGCGAERKRGIAVKHYANDEQVQSDQQKINKAWHILKRCGVGAIITDKQLGMIDANNIQEAVLVSTFKQRENFIEIVNQLT